MNETTAAYRQMIADGHQPTAQDVATLCDEVETLETIIEDERERVNVKREDIRTLRMERDQILSELVHLRAETEWLKSEAQFGTDEDQLDREAEAAGRIEWERHKRGVRGCMISDADNLGFWERRIARMQGRDEGRNERDQLRAELDALQRVNRILDDAAKDAQHYAYQLQEAREELDIARAALVEQIEARQVTEAEGGALQQMNTEIDRLRSELSRLRSAPVAVEVQEPDVVIVRSQGYTTIWWTSTPNNPRSAEAIKRHLRDNPGAVREDLWRRPPSRILKDGEMAVRADILSAMEGCVATLRADAELIPSKALAHLDALRSGEAEGRMG